jgi:TatD DNase family protein
MSIDSHCHLADEAFVEDLPAVVERARHAGLTGALCILSADEPEEVARASRVADLWPDVQFAAGIHPHRAGAYAGRAADAAHATRAALASTIGVAVGEIGLDYHYDLAPRDVQREVFASQIALALELDKPVSIHTREAWPDTLELLRTAGQGRLRGVMHCFSGSPDEARDALALGFFISLAGMLTFPKAENIREMAQVVPLDRLLIETDAPFLAPVPHRGKRNEPAWVVETLRRLAALKSVEVGQLAAQVRRNFDQFVGAAR